MTGTRRKEEHSPAFSFSFSFSLAFLVPKASDDLGQNENEGPQICRFLEHSNHRQCLLGVRCATTQTPRSTARSASVPAPSPDGLVRPILPPRTQQCFGDGTQAAGGHADSARLCVRRSVAARRARSAMRSSISSMPTSHTTGTLLHPPQDRAQRSPHGENNLNNPPPPPSRIPLYPSRGGSAVNSRPGSYAPTRDVSPRGQQRRPFQDQEQVCDPPDS